MTSKTECPYCSQGQVYKQVARHEYLDGVGNELAVLVMLELPEHFTAKVGAQSYSKDPDMSANTYRPTPRIGDTPSTSVRDSEAMEPAYRDIEVPDDAA